MKALLRLVSCLVVVVGLASGACSDPNEAPSIAAEIEALSATPGLLNPGEPTELRWHVSDALVITLTAVAQSAMPDATQPWACVRRGRDMECSASRLPAEEGAWDCDDEEGVAVCSRPMDEDLDGYRPVDTLGDLDEIGALTVHPDRTTTYRLEAEGNSGTPAVAWTQVVVTQEGVTARIIEWTAWPSPALVGEPVTLSYRTEGCDQIEPGVVPNLPRGPREGGGAYDFVGDWNAESGRIEWYEATSTRDWYLGCHPIGEVSTARIRAHISVEVVLQPEICQRVDLFTVSDEEVAPGATVELRWEVSNADWVSAEGFHVGSVQFSGTREVEVTEDTIYELIAHGECGETRAEVEVIINEDPTPGGGG